MNATTVNFTNTKEMRENFRWWAKLEECGAVWRYSGNPVAPHVVLRSGRHSDGFIDTLQFLSKVLNLISAVDALSENLRQVLLEKVDWVFGSPMAGIPFATEVASTLGVENIGFTEKKEDGKLICRFKTKVGAKVLLIEEMTTTGGTPQRGIDAILAKNPEAEIIPFVGAFLIRCNTKPSELHGAEIVPVVNLPKLGIFFNEWEPSECPLCKKGSQAITDCKQVWEDLLQTMSNPNHSTTRLIQPHDGAW